MRKTGGFQVVLPDSQHSPPLAAKRQLDEAVAGDVAAEFFEPEGAVGGGACAVDNIRCHGRMTDKYPVAKLSLGSGNS